MKTENILKMAKEVGGWVNISSTPIKVRLQKNDTTVIFYPTDSSGIVISSGKSKTYSKMKETDIAVLLGISLKTVEKKIQISDTALAILTKAGIKPADVKPTGVDGQITVKDARTAAKSI